MNSGIKLALHGIISVMLFFGLLRIFIFKSGIFFNLELVGFLFLLLLSLIAFINYATWGERVLYFVYLFYVINLLLIWFFYGIQNGFFVILILGLLGFVISLTEPKPQPKTEEELHSMVFDKPKEPKKEDVVSTTELKEESKKETKKVAVKHSPGKYVASSMGNVYHEPKCDYALKIKKHRQVWFKDKKNALAKGYRKHSCVK